MVPILGRVTCNDAFFPALVRALREVEREGLSSLLQTYNGCWNARTVARSPTAPPSFHAYGAAIDINAAANAYGAMPTMDERVVAIFERYGFKWGGDFLVPDGMHFEYGEPMEAAAEGPGSRDRRRLTRRQVLVAGSVAAAGLALRPVRSLAGRRPC